jgi:hypothetical protein
MGIMPGIVSHIAPDAGRLARWVARLIAVIGLSVMLGACSKCDVPDWLHTGSPTAPKSCHDTPQP